ncbi:MAG: type II toxin-antitoxin system VapC family toxin [Armatimonadetes bacterium]|nr:type II toxin-antitoxin system VapC family toxin [Armatimonadota bacterium]
MSGIRRPVVVDASVAIKWVLTESDSDAARSLVKRRVEMAAPASLRVETANVLWRRVQRKELTLEQALLCWDALSRIPMDLHPIEGLVQRALEHAAASERTVYDCLYVALAERLGVCLVTADESFHKALLSTPGVPRVLLPGEAAELLAGDGPHDSHK